MFSVVIPLFNKGDAIAQALASIAAQTLLPAEVIVVNDGSTDGSDAAARRFATATTACPVRVLDQPNRGVSAARNAGSAAATQPFVAFLDADDRWRPGFLATMHALIDRYPDAALYGSGFVTVRNSAGAGGHEVRRYGVRGDEIEAGDPTGGRVDYFRAFAREPVVSMSSMVAAKTMLDRVGGFPEGVTHGEDLLVWARLALTGPVVLSAEPLAEYDVGVPGQAVSYWTSGYRERFEVLAYHRFLADELRRHSPAAPASFAPYAIRQLETAALQRAYWGNLPALAEFVQAVGFDTLPLGVQGRAACWIADTRWAWGPVATMMGAVRAIREPFQRRRRAAA
jgi:glycosyltransferase involved in cell wall biosynthesis